jgi:hypothetical protein
MEVQFDGFSRFSGRGGVLPLQNGFLRSLNQQGVTARRFDGLHFPIGRHDGNYLYRSLDAQPSRNLRISGLGSLENWPPRFSGRLLAVSSSRGPKTAREDQEKKQGATHPHNCAILGEEFSFLY